MQAQSCPHCASFNNLCCSQFCPCVWNTVRLYIFRITARWRKKIRIYSSRKIPMKIFKTRSSDIVMECQNYFGFYTISTLIRKRKATFLYKLVNLCELFSFVAQEYHFIYLTCYRFIVCYFAVSAIIIIIIIITIVILCTLRGVSFLLCLVFVWIILY